MQYLICRRNDSDKLVYYKHFDGKNGCACSKRMAPRFDESTANTINRQLAALDNRGWHIVKDEV